MRAAILCVLAGCTLDPLVEDDPAVSIHVLPRGSEVPYIEDDPELVHQIEVHDGLDDADLVDADGVVPRAQAWANGEAIHYWAFGNATRVGANAYVLVDGDDELDHPWLFDTLPGDAGYSAIHRVHHVQITGAYDGEVLPTLDALFDAIELGLVEEPEPTGAWIDAPVVMPGTRLEVGDGVLADPVQVLARGWRVDCFRLGGALGEQPLRNGSAATTQVSRLREGMSAGFTPAPVFQMARPTEAPSDRANWVPLVTIVEVRLAAGITAAEIDADADLFVRSQQGSINAYTPMVDSYTVTTSMQHWPVQLEEGKP